jgi:uncharacterized protein with NRDE domain
MCLIAWNWQPDRATPLLLLANRDEFYARPALPLHWWGPATNGAEVLAGKDLQGGGTWLGVSRSGCLAALTNYRSAEPLRTDTPSRGELVAAFLQGELDAPTYLEQLAQRCSNYNPFNLLVFDGHQLMGLESRNARVLRKQAGVGAVSNADFQTPWPKLAQLKSRLQAQEDRAQTDVHSLLPLLHDRSIAPDASLPRTGVPQELERVLSATFIATPHYGTRACSVVAIHKTHVEFFEQSHGAQGLIAENHQAFLIGP